jgi:hypothetical protein
MLFQKQDMEGTHYTWNSKDEGGVYKGQPSRRLFDRYNGEQVLFLINFYASLSAESFTLQEGRRIEDQLYNHLPFGILSEISVFNWLRDSVSRVETSTH